MAGATGIKPAPLRRECRWNYNFFLIFNILLNRKLKCARSVSPFSQPGASSSFRIGFRRQEQLVLSPDNRSAIFEFLWNSEGMVNLLRQFSF